MHTGDLTVQTGARRVYKKPLPVRVAFAQADGVLTTLEGDVAYRAGDALMTGAHNEQWPIQRAKFDAAYTAEAGTRPGADGCYAKRYQEVLALRLQHAESVKVGWQDSPLQGQPGDWLLQYGPGDFGIVAADIFDMTYTLLD